MLRPKGATLAATSREATKTGATITVAAINAARKIAAASRAVLNPVVQRSAASIRGLRIVLAPVLPRQSTQRKNQFFCRVNLSPNIVANRQPRRLRPLSSLSFTSRNPHSKKQLRAHPATSQALPFLRPDPLAVPFPAVSLADFPAGF